MTSRSLIIGGQMTIRSLNVKSRFNSEKQREWVYKEPNERAKIDLSLISTFQIFRNHAFLPPLSSPHTPPPPPPFFFFLFIGLAAQSDDNSGYPNCPSYKCGDINITYPFWKIDTSTSSQPNSNFCGYQGFGINCSSGTGDQTLPEISFGGESYYIERINHEDSTIVLVVFSVESDPTMCPRVRNGINLQNTLLSLATGNANLSFHYNCTGCPSLAFDIPCLERNNSKSCVHVMNATMEEETDWDKYSCTEHVVATVIGEHVELHSNLTEQFRDILKDGVELQWRRMEGCDKCEASGGRCGHNINTTGILCFCPDSKTASRGYCPKGTHTNMKMKLVMGFGFVLISFVILSIIFCIWKSPLKNCAASLKHKTEDDINIEAFVMSYGSLSTRRYTYNDIKRMTNNFLDKLGQGGFGTVFKGKLSDGRIVAVKVLNSSKANGQEFINEVASIGRTSHVNIVTLLGFCFEYKKRALVYEYMPNGSLEKFIHSHAPAGASEHIEVNKMYEIGLGVACGLDYLHRGCNTRILHLDIKPHNILLDEDFCPKIADFGLAKLYSRKESIVSMLEARGTVGYIAPEVYNRNFGGVSHKSDVYSYGMLLLEMVGGRTNVDVDVGSGRSSEIYFPEWIYKRLHKHEFMLDSISTAKENDYARKMTIVGLWCIQPAPNQRPSISEVIEMLEGSMEALKVPPKPCFSSPPHSPTTTYSTSKSTL
ncbi:hypothetical protein SSX86_016647 [Deinandra increscens subsp. villosa]|uniref:non-specific serine/threonine protein kinase n=1 Tax=Deinandra increscens subsp. villosa TaxID=3103831 RepID=A0AAP0GY99_9ASTR